MKEQADASKVRLIPRLSQREREVVFFKIVQKETGRSLREVAKAMGISVKTANTYKTRLFEKLSAVSWLEIAYVRAADKKRFDELLDVEVADPATPDQVVLPS